MAPKTLEPVRWPLGGTAGWCPRLAHGELSAPHGAQLASSANRRKPLRRGVAPYHRRPPCLTPSQALGRLEMGCHTARLLQRTPQGVEPRTAIRAVGEHAALAPAQPPDEARVPTGRLTAAAEGPGLSERDEAL